MMYKDYLRRAMVCNTPLEPEIRKVGARYGFPKGVITRSINVCRNYSILTKDDIKRSGELNISRSLNCGRLTLSLIGLVAGRRWPSRNQRRLRTAERQEELAQERWEQRRQSEFTIKQAIQKRAFGPIDAKIAESEAAERHRVWQNTWAGHLAEGRYQQYAETWAATHRVYRHTL